MMGTMLPHFFFPAQTWEHIPCAPTLESQYIIKNLVVVTAAKTLHLTGSWLPDAPPADELGR
jgi:hypothetical protein